MNITSASGGTATQIVSKIHESTVNFLNSAPFDFSDQNRKITLGVSVFLKGLYK